MPLTAAEKQRQYRERLKNSLTEAEFAELKRKNAERERLRVKKKQIFCQDQETVRRLARQF